MLFFTLECQHPPGRDCLAESLYSFFVHLLLFLITLNHLAYLDSGAGLLCAFKILTDGILFELNHLNLSLLHNHQLIMCLYLVFEHVSNLNIFSLYYEE